MFPYNGPAQRFVSDETRRLRLAYGKLVAAREWLNELSERAFAPGTLVHVRTGGHSTPVMVTYVRGLRVFVVNDKTGRGYWVDVHRLEEFGG